METVTSPAKPKQDLNQIYELVCRAAAGKQPLSAVYEGLPRWLCPHVVGRNKQGLPRALCYQFGGESKSGIVGGPDRVGGWRCVDVEKLSQAELLAGAWHTAPRAPGQTCVAEVEVIADTQPEDTPQTGQ